MRGSPLAAVIVVFLASLPWGAAQESLPSGCRAEAGGYLCEWTATTNEALVDFAMDPEGIGLLDYDVPVFSRNLATITIELEGMDNGWAYYLISRDPATGEETVALYHDRPYNRRVTQTAHSETNVHFVPTVEGREYFLLFWLYGTYVPSNGVATIRYFVEPISDGISPPRPAATPEDPHIADIEGDVAEEQLDIVAAWFDDASVGDGLFDVHARVVDLADFERFRDERPGGLFWDVWFDVLGTSYVLEWRLEPPCALPQSNFAPCDVHTAELDASDLYCFLLRWEGDVGAAVTSPACSLDAENATLHAVLPERAVGTPGPGVPFGGIRAESRFVREEERRVSGVAPRSAEFDEFTRRDLVEEQRFAFALGGVEIWCILRVGACVPAQAWYRAPLAPENVPNTLQVLGALFAVGAFLVGLVLVRRRRTRFHALLREVDVVVAAHPHDARSGLLALGELERSFDARLRSGKMTDAEYQIASQRIATSATRLAMRRDLGLDDGRPDVDVRVRP